MGVVLSVAGFFFRNVFKAIEFYGWFLGPVYFMYLVISFIFNAALYLFRLFVSVAWPLWLFLNVVCANLAAKFPRVTKALKTAAKRLYSTTEVKEDKEQDQNIGFIRYVLYCIVYYAVKAWECTMGGLRYFFMEGIFIVIHKIFGVPLMYAGAFPQTSMEYLQTIIIGTESLGDITSQIWNYISFVLNVMNPFIMLLTSVVYQMANSLIYYISTEAGYYNDPTPPDRAGRRQLKPDSSINNPFVQGDPGWAISELTIRALQLPAVDILMAMGDFVVIIWDFVLAVVIPIIGQIASLFTGTSKAIGCCFASGEAFGCCVWSGIVKFIVLFVKILGLSSIISPTAISDLAGTGSCRAPENAPCTCSGSNGGPLIGMAGCNKIQWQCKEDNGLWVESSLRPPGTEFRVVNAAPSKQEGCPHSQTAGRRRLLLDNEEITCESYCQKWEHKGWLFDDCSDGGRYYKGDCSGNVYKLLKGQEARKHIQEYAAISRISTRERHALMYQQSPERQSANPQMSQKEFIRLVKELEKEPFQDGLNCDITFSHTDFENYILRATCLVLKLGKHAGHNFMDELPNFMPKGFTLSFTDHARALDTFVHHNKSILLLHRNLRQAHIKWHHETYNSSARLMNVSTDDIDLIKQQIRNAHHQFVILMQPIPPRGRSLYDSDNLGVFTQQGAFCEYRCPSGECVLRKDVERCTFPTEWGPANTIAYIFYTFTVFSTQLDLRYLFQATVNCWNQYNLNPGISPMNLQYFIDYAAQKDLSKYVFCFPLIPHFPYAPKFNWQIYKFLKQQCGTKFVLGRGVIDDCFCPQYAKVGAVVNFQGYFSTVTKQYVADNTYNTWRIVQYLFTRLPFVNTIIGGIWYGLVVWVYPSASDNTKLAFTTANANAGLSEMNNYACLGINLGSPWFLFTYLIFPFVIIWKCYKEFLTELVMDIISVPFRALMRFLNYLMVVNNSYVEADPNYQYYDEKLKVWFRKINGVLTPEL